MHQFSTLHVSRLKKNRMTKKNCLCHYNTSFFPCHDNRDLVAMVTVADEFTLRLKEYIKYTFSSKNITFQVFVISFHVFYCIPRQS